MTKPKPRCACGGMLYALKRSSDGARILRCDQCGAFHHPPRPPLVAEVAESTESPERAVHDESAVRDERADYPEGTESRERTAESDESTASLERAEVSESTVPAERHKLKSSDAVARGHDLREKRRAIGWTQKEFATYVGVTMGQVSRWEHAVVPAPLYTIRIADLLLQLSGGPMTTGDDNDT